HVLLLPRPVTGQPRRHTGQRPSGGATPGGGGASHRTEAAPAAAHHRPKVSTWPVVESTGRAPSGSARVAETSSMTSISAHMVAPGARRAVPPTTTRSSASDTSGAGSTSQAPIHSWYTSRSPSASTRLTASASPSTCRTSTGSSSGTPVTACGATATRATGASSPATRNNQAGTSAGPRLVRSVTVPSSTPMTGSTVHDTGLLTGSSGPAPPRSPGGPPAPPSGPGVGAARPGQSGSPPYTASHAAAADTSGTGNDPPAAKTTWPSAGVRSGRSRSVRNQPAEIARATTSLTCPAGGTVSGSSGTNPEAQASAWPEARHARATASARRANSSRTSDRSGAAPPVSGGGAQAASSSRIRPAVAWRADMWVGRREEDPGSRVLRTPRPGRAAPVRCRQPSYSALPRRYSSQLRFQSVQPSPGVTLLVVPSTITGSPQRWVRLNSHSALSRDMLMQPWVTFSVPSSAPERTVAWMNSPLRVYRIAYSMSTRYPS